MAAGALAVTRVRATGLRADGSGAIAALKAEDLETGEAFEIATNAVVDATGVWAADPDHPFRGGSLRILPSRGAHLVVPRERIANQIGLTIRVPGKIVFLVPWPDHWLIGTTDAPFEGPAARPSAAGWEVDRLLDTVNATMDVNLTRDDVVGTYAGLRPLVAPSDGSTVKASREHRVTVEANGVVRIGGGKYTTYRVMARDVIDSVLGRSAAKARPSDTAERRLIGAADTDALARIAAELMTIPAIRELGPGWRIGSSHATARKRQASSLSAPNATCCARSSPAARSSRPRSCGRSVTSSRCRSTMCSLAARGWPRSCRTEAPRSRRAWRRSWPATSIGVRLDVASRSRPTWPGRAASSRWRPPARPVRPTAR